MSDLTLFPDHPRELALATIEGRVPVPSANEVFHRRARDGRSWILKVADSTSLSGDALGLLLCQRVGVQCPELAKVSVHTEPLLIPSGLSWPPEYAIATEFVPETHHWDPRMWEEITNKADLGGLLALDAVLGVNGRHSENVLLQVTGQTRLLWAIDFDNADVVPPAPMDEDPQKVPLPPVLPQIPLDDVVLQGAQRVAMELERIPCSQIRPTVEAAFWTVGRKDGREREVADLLEDRFRTAFSLKDAVLRALEAP